MTGQHKLEAVVIRVAAPGDFFTEDRVVDTEYMRRLKEAEKRNPVHVPTTANEIRGIRKCFKGVKIIAISDSAFHWDKKALQDFPFHNEMNVRQYISSSPKSLIIKLCFLTYSRVVGPP